ncbi:MAG: response regulator transcription factor [Desulfovibrionales bacterium]|nr:response regulator transcription factor [Desulfovibrionales bacterium]
MTPRILIIEDNPDLAELLCLNFETHAWKIDHAQDGRNGYKKAREQQHDLIVLDLTLPGMDGMDILKTLRREGIRTPILILTSKSDEIDRILGLELGADDYVTKPFSIRELVARIKAIFRRTGDGGDQEANLPLTRGDLSIDPESRRVVVKDTLVELTPKEFELLHYFARHPGRVFTRTQLLDNVWGYGHDGYAHTVNANINRLRSKIEMDPTAPEYILTVWGVGYKFRDDD